MVGRFAGFRGMGRVFGPDFMYKVCAALVRQEITHFLYGGKEGVAEVSGGPCSKEVSLYQSGGHVLPAFSFANGIRERRDQGFINRSGAQIVWVGLSTPKQEKWMGEFCGALSAKVLLGVGAAFDYNTEKNPKSSALDATGRPRVVLSVTAGAEAAGPSICHWHSRIRLRYPEAGARRKE